MGCIGVHADNASTGDEMAQAGAEPGWRNATKAAQGSSAGEEADQ
jgi:hypothetical protein